jgi:hypothetical protein
MSITMALSIAVNSFGILNRDFSKNEDQILHQVGLLYAL